MTPLMCQKVLHVERVKVISLRIALKDLLADNRELMVNIMKVIQQLWSYRTSYSDIKTFVSCCRLLTLEQMLWLSLAEYHN